MRALILIALLGCGGPAVQTEDDASPCGPAAMCPGGDARFTCTEAGCSAACLCGKTVVSSASGMGGVDPSIACSQAHARFISAGGCR